MACLLAFAYTIGTCSSAFCLRGFLRHPFLFFTFLVCKSSWTWRRKTGGHALRGQMEAKTHETSLPGCRADMKYNDFTLFEFRHANERLSAFPLLLAT
jgi:hypothetical protein